MKLVEFAGEVIKGSETVAAFIFGDKTKEYNVTLTRGRVGAEGGKVSGQVAIRVRDGPMFPILKAEVIRDCLAFDKVLFIRSVGIIIPMQLIIFLLMLNRG